MLHHIRNSCRRRGILGAGAFGITRGNFGLSSQLFLEMFYCGGSNCFEGGTSCGHMISSLISALRWGVFVSLFLSLLLLVWVPLFLCLLSVFFHLSFSCCGYVFVLISVCLSFIFDFPALLAEKAAKRYDLPPFLLSSEGAVARACAIFLSAQLSPLTCLLTFACLCITFLGYSVQRQDWYIYLPVVFSKIL